jgi:nucleoside-diphosphate-sugar epimerase
MSEWAILGCGYVGTRLARRLLAEGHSVRAFSRHPEKLATLAELGARVQMLDASKPRQFGPALYGARSPVIVYSIPSLGNMPAGEPVRRACEAAMAVAATRFIYLSSTAVYGPTPEGEVVDEDSSLSLYDADGAPRIADESAVESGRLSGLSTIVLRLAAVYGPGRGVRERLKAGNYKLIDEGEHMFSRVHVDDVVGILLTAAERAPNPAIYCVADDRPTTQKEYADWLVGRLGMAAPPSVPSLAPGRPRRPVRNRAVSNARLKRELGYVFRYPTYLEGELAVEAEQGQSPPAPAPVPPAPSPVQPAPSTVPPAPSPVPPAPSTDAPAVAPPPVTATPAASAQEEAKAILKKAQELTQLLQRLLADLELTVERWKQR